MYGYVWCRCIGRQLHLAKVWVYILGVVDVDTAKHCLAGKRTTIGNDFRDLLARTHARAIEDIDDGVGGTQGVILGSGVAGKGLGKLHDGQTRFARRTSAHTCFKASKSHINRHASSLGTTKSALASEK